MSSYRGNGLCNMKGSTGLTEEKRKQKKKEDNKTTDKENNINQFLDQIECKNPTRSKQK